jgi:exopolyphosphatase/guanosine-5'-triphosphate,3'-diphosphate pyrophosphatase
VAKRRGAAGANCKLDAPSADTRAADRPRLRPENENLSFPLFHVFRGSMFSGRVAIIDIGSNSIKVLVAERAADGSVAAVYTKTLDARISAGISHAHPRLSEENMARGLTAIRDLIDATKPHAPDRFVLVATSAVRDAQNGREFRERVRAATGHEIRILSGEEEADLIGRGLTCDPALASLTNFYVFDLGGGSLECLSFLDRRVLQAASLRLGCVRLTEKFVSDPSQPLSPKNIAAIAEHTRMSLAAAPFLFSLQPDAIAIGTGGTMTTVRSILAAKSGVKLEETSTQVELTDLRAMLDDLGTLPLALRKTVIGLPPARADVFPTALATLVAVAEAGGFSAYRHSMYNLRFGLAMECLDSSSS